MSGYDGEKNQDGKENEYDNFDAEKSSRVVCRMRSKRTAGIDVNHGIMGGEYEDRRLCHGLKENHNNKDLLMTPF